MIRLGLSLIFASVVVHAANAGDIPPSREPAQPRSHTHCDILGEGFFPVAGSNACIQISGHISAGAGFESPAGSTRYSSQHFGASHANGFDNETAASGDLRFDTPAGPARVYIDVRKDTNPRWVLDGR